MRLPIAAAEFQLARIQPDDLVGLPIGEAIRRFVIRDPAVLAAGRNVIEYDFESAQFSRAYNRCLWPVQLNAGDLSSKFVRGGGDPDRLVPERVVAVAQLMIVRYAEIAGFLRTGEIVAKDIQNNPVDCAIWLGPNLAIDIQVGHLYEILSIEQWRYGYKDSYNRLLLERLHLSLPATVAIPDVIGLPSMAKGGLPQRPREKKLPLREAVMPKKRGITSSFDLHVRPSRSRVAAETPSRVKGDSPKRRSRGRTVEQGRVHLTVMAALRKRGIASRSALRERIIENVAGEIAQEIVGIHVTANHVGAMRARLSRLKDVDFLQK